MNRFLTAVFSSICFATLLAVVSYVPSTQREPNIYYFSFLETFIFVILYAGSVFILAGIPLSILIDKLVGRYRNLSKWALYLVKLGAYSFTGVVVGLLYFIMVFQNFKGVISFSLYGCLASNVYFHFLLLLTDRRTKD
ncbi:hypothetical protein SAMN05192559_101892 [Halobacillus karajensis]|nr:hypothetical protein SAMN05192559_101892 [Halobacillus karajensis]